MAPHPWPAAGGQRPKEAYGPDGGPPESRTLFVRNVDYKAANVDERALRALFSVRLPPSRWLPINFFLAESLTSNK